MAQKKRVVIELVFEETQDEFDEDYTYLKPKHVKLHKDTTLSPDELSALGEEIGQTDRWQVDNMNAIQNVLGGSSTKAKLH